MGAAGAAVKYKKEFKNSIASIWYQIESSLENPVGAKRAAFYPSSRPYFIIDGNFLEEFLAGSEAKILSKINERVKLTAPVTITISSSCSLSSGSASVTVKNISQSAISGKLHFLVKERGVKYTDQWKAGFVDNVMRDMQPDYNGESVTIAPGMTITKTRSFTLNSTWKKDSCKLVAFLQKSDKEIVEGCVVNVNAPVSISKESSTCLQKRISVKLHKQSLTISIPEKGSGVISIFDAQGKMFSRFEFSNTTEWIELPAIARPGTLFLSVDMKHTKFTERIVLF